MDCSLLANDCINARLKEGKTRVVCKIDMEKSYDHTNCSFVDRVLQRMSFIFQWRNWMEICVSSPSFCFG